MPEGSEDEASGPEPNEPEEPEVSTQAQQQPSAIPAQDGDIGSPHGGNLAWSFEASPLPARYEQTGCCFKEQTVQEY
ncbi:UNVERIFIED_CONTAM: hypothetical protein K2H54_048489 [Gekko kuhli]